MWPVVVLGILTAIFAWIWYGGSGDAKEPQTPVQKEETQPESVEPEQRLLPAAETKLQDLRLSDADTNITHDSIKEPPTDLPRKGGLQADIKEPLTDLPRKGELQADIQEPLTDLPRKGELQADLQEPPTDLPRKGGLQADIQEPLTDLPRKGGLQADIQEPPTDLPRKGELQADLQEPPTDLPRKGELQADLQEPPTDLPSKGELQADLQEPPTDLPRKGELQADLQEPPTDLPSKGELQADIKEPPTDLPRKGELQADIQEPPTDLLSKGELQADIQEPPTDLPRKGGLQADIQEPPTDLLSKGELQADIQEPPTDLPRKGGLQADTQEPPTDAPNKDDQANILEQHTCLLEEHLENHKEITSKNDEVDAHPSDIPEAREVPYTGDQVYPPLKKEVQPEEERPHNVGTAVLRANGEVACPALMAEEPGAQKLLGGPCHGSVSQHKKGHPVNDSLDGVCANGEVNGAKQTAENAADRPLENSLLVEENVMNVSESKEPLNQALFLQMVNKSIEDAYAVVADQLKHESVEKCDIKRESTCSDTLKSSTSLQDHISTPEGLSNVHKLGTSPESSPVDICNLLSNQENEMASFGSSNSDEKTSFGGPSEASVHETDHLKTRQVATIHPMSQNVNFAFKVHYITHSDSQVIGITGDHEKLGKWETYVPLTSVNGGFWSHSIALPSDTNVAWKLVMVENGKIQRWEECNNRFLKTSHEDIEDQLSWGYP